MMQDMSVLNSGSLPQKVLVEQIRILYRFLLPVIAVNFMVSIALLYGLWDVVSQTSLTVWLIMILAVLVLRLLSYFFYLRYFRPESAQRYGTYFVIGTGITGLLWGIGGVMLFPPGALEYQLFILFVLVSMGAGSVSSLTIYLPAFYAYFPVSMIPIAFKLMFDGGSIQLSLGLMTIVYILALSYFGRDINRSLKQSLQLRFENIDLVEQLRQQKDEAEHANIAKSKFLAAASHDLRQPLHALTLFTSVLDESVQKPKVRKVVDQIKASVGALQSLFNALLDISRLEAGVMKAEKTDFYLAPLFKKVANDFDTQAKQKGLKINWQDCVYAVHTDQTLLERILRNYISNAIRYTNRGEITITCKVEDDMVTIDVIDTGVGIPVKEQKAIFDEFHQLYNQERDRSKGLGLGLAIVQRTARLLGHTINVESQPGEGSTFSINLERAEITKHTEKNDSPVHELPAHTGKVLVAVIDDESSVREGMQTLLDMWGCDVFTAADLNELLAALRQDGRIPDGIIADFRLRDNKTGIEAIHAIHAEYNNDIPALIVTGDIAVDRLREVNNSGFQVLHKPVAPLKVRNFIRSLQLRKK
jgi:signal transduction histidine kinase